MSYGVPAATAATAGAGAAAAAAIAQAIKASGVIVQIEPDDFLAMVQLLDDPIVVAATRPRVLFVPAKRQYLTTYKGLAFYAESPTALPLPNHAEVIASKKIWVP